MEKQFLNYINWFRGIAIISVVFGHTIPLIDWQSEEVKRSIDAFFSGGTVLFVFIAGYLFEHLKERFRIRNYFRSKLKNVLAPYTLISIPAIAIYILGYKTDHRWILTHNFLDLPPYIQALKFYISGAHLGPLWFIPMIMLMFLISPLLLKTMNNKWFKITLVITTAILFYIFPRPLLNENILQSFLHFVFVYYLGMIFSNSKAVINTFLHNKKILSVLGVAFLTALPLAIYTRDLNLFFAQKFLFILIIIGFLLNFEKTKRFKLLDNLAKYSFGIYFIHGYLIAVISMLKLKLSGILPYFIMASGIVLFSWGIVYLIKKIVKNKSRYLIGC